METSASFFDQLLRAAAAQAQPQRLLFVFAHSELPDDATPAQRAAHAAGRGGALAPLACVDKLPAQLSSFEALAAEAREACPGWQAVFIGALGGGQGKPPTDAHVDSALKAMVESIRTGRLGGYLALDRQGLPLQFS